MANVEKNNFGRGIESKSSLRKKLPVILFGIGILQIFLLHSIFRGLFLISLSGFIYVFRAIKSRVYTVETSGRSSDSIVKEPHQNLRRQLSKFQGVDGCEDLATQGSEQLIEAHARMETYRRLLEIKLGPSELTYERYYSSGEQVFLSMIDRLQLICELLLSIEGIRPTEVREKLRQNPMNDEVFRDRLEISRKQQEKVVDLLRSNERALTQMDQANAALTDMKTQAGLATLNLPEALKQLEKLASRVKDYSSK